MTDQPILIGLTTPDDGYRAGRVTYWRTVARESYALGQMELAARCETNASSWEWGIESEEGES